MKNARLILKSNKVSVFNFAYEKLLFFHNIAYLGSNSAFKNMLCFYQRRAGRGWLQPPRCPFPLTGV